MYIQDLEGQLKTHTDQQDSHSSIVLDLKKEITRLKELNVQMNEHTTEIEARLAMSETRGTSLVSQIEQHEESAAQREDAYRDLERHIAVLDTSQDNKLLLEELEQKDRRVAELEAQVNSQNSSAAEERTKVLGALEAEKAIQVELRSQLAKAQSDDSSHFNDLSMVSDNAKEAIPSGSSPTASHKELPVANGHIPNGNSEPTDDDEVARLRHALEELAARCNAAETRFAEAEDKVSDLSSQLSEAKLIRAEMDDVMPVSAALATPSIAEEMSEVHLQTPQRMSPSPSPTRTRPSPMRRSSVPTLSTLGTVQKKDFRHGRALADLKRSR